MKRIGVVLILVLAFLGLADSAYLAQHEATGTPLICTTISGCNVVAASQYSHIFGIPVAQFGVLFYSILFVLAALELVIFDRLLRRVLQVLAIIGLLVSLYSTFVQVFLIQALCEYCLASALFTVLVFVLASFIEPIKKTAFATPPTPPHAPPTPPHLSMPPVV